MKNRSRAEWRHLAGPSGVGAAAEVGKKTLEDEAVANPEVGKKTLENKYIHSLWIKLWTSIVFMEAEISKGLAKDTGLTHYEFQVLLALHDNPGGTLRLKALANKTGASLSRLSHVMDKLERNKYVTRKNYQGYKNTFAVITDLGRKSVIDGTEGYINVVRRLMEERMDEEVAGS